MDWLSTVSFFSFVLNAVIVIAVIALNRESLTRIRNIIDILTNGGYANCPFYRESMLKGGRRWYDKHIHASDTESKQKGGENL